MMDMGFDGFGAQPVLRVDQSNLDEVERNLLPMLRHFLTSICSPETQAWHVAYTIASERWGQSVGLAMAHSLFEVAKAVSTVLEEGVHFHDPLHLETRDVMTGHEVQILSILHHMRRDETSAARMMLEHLTHGCMHPELVRAGLRFAARFPAGVQDRATATRPDFKVIH